MTQVEEYKLTEQQQQILLLLEQQNRFPFRTEHASRQTLQSFLRKDLVKIDQFNDQGFWEITEKGINVVAEIIINTPPKSKQIRRTKTPHRLVIKKNCTNCPFYVYNEYNNLGRNMAHVCQAKYILDYTEINHKFDPDKEVHPQCPLISGSLTITMDTTEPLPVIPEPNPTQDEINQQVNQLNNLLNNE